MNEPIKEYGNDLEIRISVCDRKTDKRYKNVRMKWNDIKNRNASPILTTETIEEYPKLSKSKRDELKDHGGFVGGWLKEGSRKNGHVTFRSIGALDADLISDNAAFLSDVKKALIQVQYFMYSTHSHTPEEPRYRIVILFSRDVSEDEYPALMRQVAHDIGMDYFDDTTYQANRMMYWASCPSNADFYFFEQDAEPLKVDRYLARYADWKDASQWPTSSRQSEVVFNTIKTKGDPLKKDGIVGAFCRTYYPIEDAIEAFLSDRYESSVIPGRYSYIGASTTAGLVIYDQKFAYSFHASDPACGKSLNAFDLVRIHLYGDDNPLASFNQMADFANKDENVKHLILSERQSQAKLEFADSDDSEWMKELVFEKRSHILQNSLHNLLLILRNDKKLQSIVYNQLRDCIEIRGEVPWNHPSRFWRDADDAQLISYIDGAYGTFSSRNYEIAVAKVTDDRSYHPVKEYFASLPIWDGEIRAERIFIDYLGASDTEYTRQVTRKTLCAAYKRILSPGCKFDSMPVLRGPQGIGKSTMIAKLAGPWYSDSLHLSDTKDKTAAEKLQGYWILEIGELAGLRKAETETLRSFITRQDDIYRAAFGRRATPHPRQCIFIGTTNAENGYLRDITGNRRFWPVNTPGGTSKHPWQVRDEDIKQIWSEIKFYVNQGEQLYLEPEIEKLAQIEQRNALEGDEREGIVADFLSLKLPKSWDEWDLAKRRAYLDGFGWVDDKPSGTLVRTKVCTMEIWCECFGRDRSMIRRSDSNELIALLLKLGWLRQEIKERLPIYGPQTMFYSPENFCSEEN